MKIVAVKQLVFEGMQRLVMVFIGYRENDKGLRTGGGWGGWFTTYYKDLHQRLLPGTPIHTVVP